MEKYCRSSSAITTMRVVRVSYRYISGVGLNNVIHRLSLDFLVSFETSFDSRNNTYFTPIRKWFRPYFCRIQTCFGFFRFFWDQFWFWKQTTLFLTIVNPHSYSPRQFVFNTLREGTPMYWKILITLLCITIHNIGIV